MSITHNIQTIQAQIGEEVQLVAVTKTKPLANLMEAYNGGFKRFGENKVQEMVMKYEALPKDIEWHLIGHLQTNKVKYIAPFVHLIHSVDSLKLLQEINKQAAKYGRVINCLLQVYIAQEETKFGLSEEEVEEILFSENMKELTHIQIVGLMGIASNTDNDAQVRKEFRSLKTFFDKLNTKLSSSNSYSLSENLLSEDMESNIETPPSGGRGLPLSILSMGMSSDYQMAIEEGSTMVRVGSAIFGARL